METFRGNGCFTRGGNFRMQHFQAAMLLQQIEKLVHDTEIRRANADYLSEHLRQIPGIAPARLPEDSRAVWHLYPLRYDAHHFHGLSREKFVHALGAEGIPCSGGYSEQYLDGMFDEAISSRGYRRLWPAERLKAYRDSFRELPGNRHVCQTTVGCRRTSCWPSAAAWITLSTRSARSRHMPKPWRRHERSRSVSEASITTLPTARCLVCRVARP